MSVSESINVEVSPQYLPDQSDPTAQQFVFAYHITITNLGDVAAQLLTRHWIITDANGQAKEVRGEGVVGDQPNLQPGEAYSYTSGVMLETEVGTMAGSYQMINDAGDIFDAEVPIFRLSVPGVVN